MRHAAEGSLTLWRTAGGDDDGSSRSSSGRATPQGEPPHSLPIPGSPIPSHPIPPHTVRPHLASVSPAAFVQERIALLCQKAENLVVGAPCGVMDQMASALGRSAMLLSLLCQPAQVGGLVSFQPAGRRCTRAGTNIGARLSALQNVSACSPNARCAPPCLSLHTSEYGVSTRASGTPSVGLTTAPCDALRSWAGAYLVLSDPIRSDT